MGEPFEWTPRGFLVSEYSNKLPCGILGFFFVLRPYKEDDLARVMHACNSAWHCYHREWHFYQPLHLPEIHFGLRLYLNLVRLIFVRKLTDYQQPYFRSKTVIKSDSFYIFQTDKRLSVELSPWYTVKPVLVLPLLSNHLSFKGNVLWTKNIHFNSKVACIKQPPYFKGYFTRFNDWLLTSCNLNRDNYVL